MSNDEPEMSIEVKRVAWRFWTWRVAWSNGSRVYRYIGVAKSKNRAFEEIRQYLVKQKSN